MTTNDCPRCGAVAEGAFCAACGARLRPPPCRACGAVPPPAARYCSNCGRRLAEGLRISPAAVLAVLGVAAIAAALLLPGRSPGGPGGDASGFAASGDAGSGGPAAPVPSLGAGSAPPALSGDMRANADGLFDRIMRELAAGDTARARFFVPMALDAYGMAGDLDADGRFHLSLVQALGGDYDAARATAESILAENPNHLLALAAAADAAEAAGDGAAALAYRRRYLQAYEDERGKDLPEYRDHARILPDYEAAARAAAGG